MDLFKCQLSVVKTKLSGSANNKLLFCKYQIISYNLYETSAITSYNLYNIKQICL